MNTTENNKLIAKFMGLTPAYSANEIVGWYEGESLEYFMPEIEYNQSWNYLMSVLEKIPTLNPENGKLWFEYEISRNHCRVWANKGFETMNNARTTLEAVYTSVIAFITWYNSQNK